MQRLCAALSVLALALALSATALGSDFYPKAPVPSSRDALRPGAKAGKMPMDPRSGLADKKVVTPVNPAKAAKPPKPVETKTPASLQ